MIALVLLPQLSEAEEGQLIDAGELNGPLGSNLSPEYLYDSTVARANPLINSKNQLPPLIRITMVAIDEVSAGRLSEADNAALAKMLGGLFNEARDYEEDLSTLEEYLVENNINYRVFTSNVSISGAKWSREQAN